LSFDRPTFTNSLRVFSGPTALDSFDENTERVLFGLKMDQLEGLLNNQTGFQFLAAIPTMEHNSIDESFNNGAVGFSESEYLVLAGGVGDENLGFDSLKCNMIFKY